MADVTLTEAEGFGLATILPYKGVDEQQVGGALGMTITPGPFASRAGALTLLGTGPRQWLAYADEGGADWCNGLGDRLRGAAGVVDQSSAYLLFNVAGSDALRLLQKGIPVDLSHTAFPPGSVAVSAIAHIGVIAHHAAPGIFHLAVSRSFAVSLRHWLKLSIAAL